MRQLWKRLSSSVQKFKMVKFIIFLLILYVHLQTLLSLHEIGARVRAECGTENSTECPPDEVHHSQALETGCDGDNATRSPDCEGRIPTTIGGEVHGIPVTTSEVSTTRRRPVQTEPPLDFSDFYDIKLLSEHVTEDECILSFRKFS